MASIPYIHIRTLIVMILIIFSSTMANMKTCFSIENGAEIDLFTQKGVYDGKGLNISCDAFSPDEEVKVFAFITYSCWPEEGVLVAFQIFGPKNSIENITFSRVATTNETGIAFITFRLPHDNEIIFGEWTIIGNVRVAEQTVQDTLSFRVGWIIDILSIRTINAEYEYQKSFPHHSLVGIELILHNIAMRSINTTLTANLADSADIMIGSLEVIDFTISANSTIVFQHLSILIPGNAHLGEATVYADAYTAPISLGGVPYCPEAKTFITIEDIVHDIAIVDVHPSRTWVYAGEDLQIAVIIRNFGHFTESFNVTLHYNIHTTPQTIGVINENLEPLESKTIQFTWDTTNVSKGNYTLSALADEVVGEENTENNLFVDGIVEIKKEKMHDVAVVYVEPQITCGYIGEKIDVNVTVKNFGDYEEYCRVTLFYNISVVGSLSVTLAIDSEEVLVFQWETEGSLEGNYILKAFIDEVAGEENLENNLFVNGAVTLEERTKTPSIWVLWLSPLLILIIILLVIWFYYRRKRNEEAKKEFHSGWTAWYSRKSVTQSYSPSKQST